MHPCSWSDGISTPMHVHKECCATPHHTAHSRFGCPDNPRVADTRRAGLAIVMTASTTRASAQSLPWWVLTLGCHVHPLPLLACVHTYIPSPCSRVCIHTSHLSARVSYAISPAVVSSSRAKQCDPEVVALRAHREGWGVVGWTWPDHCSDGTEVLLGHSMIIRH
jgi:hypothetical protein